MIEREWLTLDKRPVEDLVKEIDLALSTGEHIVHIGTDAQKSDRKVNFVTCVALVRPRKGGRVFYTKVTKPSKECGSLQKKLFMETQLTIETALELVDKLPKDVEFVIHLDVNPNVKWDSSRHVKELVGWVMGSGFQHVLIKPNSWLASHCADHAVKNKNDRNMLR